MSDADAQSEETTRDAEPSADHRSPLAEEAKRAIEAIVMVSDEPADPRLLAQLIEISATRVDELCNELAAEYDAERRGFALVRVAGGWRFQSRGEMSPYVERFVLTGQSARLSAAALETLSIVAYKQPISRAQVAAIRGVSVDGVMRTLQQRGYIGELARDPGPGQAVLFGTTSLFLERLGLDSLDELPPLGDFVPSPDVVEALEAGLRVSADEEQAPPASTDAESAVPSETAVPTGSAVPASEPDEPVIDLREEPQPEEPQLEESTREPIALDALDVLADD
ncbi:MAG TPA: SMC-Scp complex subunit ScpB [Microthrixaceae bacterium]|nr:SMC-Scp complex subunit ScpB [Microthrixaceae bacterium]